MKKNDSLINYTFQRVAALCGLRLSYYVTAAALIFSFLFLTLLEYRTGSPLYILLFLALLPSLVHTILFSSEKQKNEKRENSLSFPLFCKKYRYQSSFHQAMKIAYFFIFLLLAAWHISCSSDTELPELLRMLPAGIAALSLITRVFGTIGYRIYFHTFPFKAMR